jgi:hypothetical protein
MREQRCGWHEPNFGNRHFGNGHFGNGHSSTPSTGLKRLGQHALALCPAYAAIARVAARG